MAWMNHKLHYQENESSSYVHPNFVQKKTINSSIYHHQPPQQQQEKQNGNGNRNPYFYYHQLQQPSHSSNAHVAMIPNDSNINSTSSNTFPYGPRWHGRVKKMSYGISSTNIHSHHTGNAAFKLTQSNMNSPMVPPVSAPPLQEYSQKDQLTDQQNNIYATASMPSYVLPHCNPPSYPSYHVQLQETYPNPLTLFHPRLPSVRPAYAENLFAYSESLFPNDFLNVNEERTPLLLARSNSSSSVVSCASVSSCSHTGHNMQPYGQPSYHHHHPYYYQTPATMYSLTPGKQQFTTMEDHTVPIPSSTPISCQNISSLFHINKNKNLRNSNKSITYDTSLVTNHSQPRCQSNYFTNTHENRNHEDFFNNHQVPNDKSEHALALMCAYVLPIVIGSRQSSFFNSTNATNYSHMISSTTNINNNNRSQRRIYLINILQHVFSSHRVFKSDFKSERTNVILIALYYLNQLKETKQWSFTEKYGADYRVFVVAMMLASKYLDDYSASAKTWSHSSGIPLEELIQLEMNFLYCLEFKMHVGLEILSNWKALIERMIAQHGQMSQVYKRQVFTSLRQ